jgi:hypothetical protein
VEQVGLAAVTAPLVASTQGLQAEEPKVRKAQKICCVNNAAFMMRFQVGCLKNKDGQGPEGFTGETENYPVLQKRTIDLRDYKLATGSRMRPRVYAVLDRICTFRD